MRPIGISQGVAHAALVGPEELARMHDIASLVRLGSNESPFGPSPRALTAMVREAASSARYGDPSCAELRAAIARHHGVAIDNVAVGAGIDDLLGWIVRAYLRPGAPAVAGLGTFPTFEMHVTGYGGCLERVPYLASGKLDLAGMRDATTRLGAALVFVPNPDNPTGSSYSWADVVSFVDDLPDESLVIHDEAYANFLPSDERFPAGAIDRRIIRLRTFSKEYGLAGLRVGYALAAPESIVALDAVRLLYGVSRPALAAALAALEDAAFIDDVVAEIAKGREEYRLLGGRLGLPTLPSTTNFVLFDFGSPSNAKNAVGFLLARGIHVRKPPEPPLDRFVRISVGNDCERAFLAEILSAYGNPQRRTEAASKLRTARNVLRELVDGGIYDGPQFEKASRELTMAEDRRDDATMHRETQILIGSQSNDETPFEELSEHYVPEPGLGGLASTAPAIRGSFYIHRSYVERFGFSAGPKLLGVVRQHVADYVHSATSAGLIEFDELRRTIEATTGVASVAWIEIDAGSADVIVPKEPAHATSIHFIRVRIDLSS